MKFLGMILLKVYQLENILCDLHNDAGKLQKLTFLLSSLSLVLILCVLSRGPDELNSGELH